MTLFNDFDAELTRQGKSAITRRGYLADLNDYASWIEQTYGEPLDPTQITADDVRAYLAYLATVRRARPSTTNRRRAALRAFCRWAVERGLLKTDPTAETRGIRQTKSPPKALERAELNRILRRAQQWGNPLHIAIVTTLANTGLRVSELCDVAVGDVEIKPRSGKLLVRLGKGEKSREIPLNGDVRRALGDYLAVRRQPADGDHLFVSQRGAAITPAGVWRIVNKYGRHAGIKGVSPHVLRHTFATLLLREGDVDLVTVSDLLGHENINTTARYTRSTEADRQAAVEKLALP
ncbi:MAG: tyrosine-type recombinase/integrase [Thermoflexales bacterium]|nr:tyrosine-type recombinase/integrase [Thermoflexales bacterium]